MDDRRTNKDRPSRLTEIRNQTDFLQFNGQGSAHKTLEDQRRRLSTIRRSTNVQTDHLGLLVYGL